MVKESPQFHGLKIIALTVLLISLALSLLDMFYAPAYLETVDSRPPPAWVARLIWLLTAIGTLIFFVVEVQQ